MSEIYKGPIEEVKIVQKVKLTEEQSKTLEKMRACHHLRNDKEAILAKHGRGWSGGYKTLNEINILSFASLVLNDFKHEIESEQPKFQPGDKIIDLSVEGCPLIKIHTVSASELFGTWGKGNQTCVHKVNARIATSEEIYWLETLGREKVGDFRNGDIFLADDDTTFLIGSDIFIDRARDWVKQNRCNGIYPAESFKPFTKED